MLAPDKLKDFHLQGCRDPNHIWLPRALQHLLFKPGSNPQTNGLRIRT